MLSFVGCVSPFLPAKTGGQAGNLTADCLIVLAPQLLIAWAVTVPCTASTGYETWMLVVPCQLTITTPAVNGTVHCIEFALAGMAERV